MATEKLCAICGKPFKCVPSSAKATCSKECSSIYRSQQMKGKPSNMSAEERQKRAERMRNYNLKERPSSNGIPHRTENSNTPLARLRHEKGMTQKDLADALGVFPINISRWESEASEPDMKFLARYAKIFGMTLDDFLVMYLADK